MPTFLPNNREEVLFWLLILALGLVVYFLEPYFRRGKPLESDDDLSKHRSVKEVLFGRLDDIKDIVIDVKDFANEIKVAQAVNTEKTLNIEKVVTEIRHEHHELRKELSELQREHHDFHHKGYKNIKP